MPTVVNKFKDLKALEALLLKARRHLSDEAPEEEEDVAPEEVGMREFDPDAESDDADKWLAENDPESGAKEPEEYDPEAEREKADFLDDPEYEEYEPDEDEEAHQKEPEEPTQPSSEGRFPQPSSEGRFPQPSREEIGEMRQYTRPWEQRARNKAALEAKPVDNPILYRQGQLVESGANAYKDRQEAYAAHKASSAYKNASPIQRIKLDAQFKKEWNEQHPEHAINAVRSHSAAHEAGKKAKTLYEAAKADKMRHALTGGAQAEMPMSTEEAYQHVGGSKGEEGTTGSTVQDPSSAFAAGNKEFVADYLKNHAHKLKKPENVEGMMNYDEDSKKDVQRILGEHPGLKDPANKARVDQFFQKYHPLIGMSAKKVMNKLGLEQNKGDLDLGMLHEAGMHGLMQAINDYNHDHPGKASFATHAGNKIRGLQQTAMRAQDQVPQELRTGAKKFNQGHVSPPAVLDHKSIIARHPPDVQDRLKRVDALKATAPKVQKLEGGGNESM
jgi:hypothetical protein